MMFFERIIVCYSIVYSFDEEHDCNAFELERNEFCVYYSSESFLSQALEVR